QSPYPRWPPHTSTRPPLISSTVVTTLARLPTVRNVTGDTSVPRVMVDVSGARPARTGTAHVRGCGCGRGEAARGGGGRRARRPGEALVVVGPEERFEADRLGPLDDRQLF